MPNVPESRTVQPMVTESNIAVQTHGRYLSRAARSGATAGILVGFHGYGESADSQFARLDAVAGSAEWKLVSIQGLHRFYQRRTEQVVASWMTTQDRQSAIADNIAYVSTVVEREAADRVSASTAVFAGFSQGVAMAFRAAVHSNLAQRHVIAVGGDVPPELEGHHLAGLSSVLLCRGTADPWYSDELFQADLRRLNDLAVPVRHLVFDGGHDWSDQVGLAVADYLRQCSRETAERVP